ncbi:MAG TPA: TlpA disulfide reductase family protein, partial [Vicinamibacteria bacterium]|nr:TlpA disulfide reductase family protein [Vicinamibacteria bacterium]
MSSSRVVTLTAENFDTEALAKGRVAVVDFWASWCPPCQEELPVLRTMDEAYRDRGLHIVGVSVQESSVEDVRAYA